MGDQTDTKQTTSAEGADSTSQKPETCRGSQRPSWQVLPQRGGARIRVRYREGIFATSECRLCK